MHMSWELRYAAFQNRFPGFTCFSASSFGGFHSVVSVVWPWFGSVAMSFRMVHALGLEIPIRSLERARSRVDNTGNLPIGFGYGGVNNGYGVNTRDIGTDILDLEGIDSDYDAFDGHSETDSIDSEFSTISGASSDGSGVREGSVNSDKASSVEDPELSLSNEVVVEQEVEKKEQKEPKPLVSTKDSGKGSSETHDKNWAKQAFWNCARASWWITTSLLCKRQESWILLCSLTTSQRTPSVHLQHFSARQVAVDAPIHGMPTSLCLMIIMKSHSPFV